MTTKETPDLYLTDERYHAALVRHRYRIATGIPLQAFNSDDYGGNDTTCSWGLCSRQKKAWPDAEDHIWPSEFLGAGRVAPKYRQGEQFCPFDTKEPPPGHLMIGPSGCYYRCRIFQAAVFSGGVLPTRKRALELYDQALAK